MFAQIIERYSDDFIKITLSPGYYSPLDGSWNPGNEITEPKRGAILPLTTNDLQYEQAGAYTQDDRKLYALEKYNAGETIVYQGRRYTVHREIDHGKFGVYIYFVRAGDNVD